MNPRRPETGARPCRPLAGAIALGLIWGGSLFVRAQTTGGGAAPSAPAGAPESFERFSLIGNLNIFDASRVGWSPGRSVPPVDTIALVGTLESSQGRMAFFDSPNALYRRVLREGGTIAQFTVKRIEPNGVELAHDAQVIPLAVRQTLRRPAGGDWSVGGVRAPDTPGAAAAAAVPPDASDVLKRLIEQRQQQLKQ